MVHVLMKKCMTQTASKMLKQKRITSINTSVRMFASVQKNNTSQTPPLRAIHFEKTTEQQPVLDFQIVGVRDVEVEDYEYPTRIESEQKATRVLRNPYASKNFISLWIDQLAVAENFLKNHKIQYKSIQHEQGHEGLTIAPDANENSMELFNLCDKPTFVELLQATPEVLKEYQDGLLDEEHQQEQQQQQQ